MGDYYDDSTDTELEAARAQLAEVEQRIEQETGAPASDLEGLTYADIQAMIDEGEAEDNAVAQDLAERSADALLSRAGYTPELIAEERYRGELAAAMEKARNGGGWTEYLKVKAARESNVDRSGAQDNSGHVVQKWW